MFLTSSVKNVADMLLHIVNDQWFCEEALEGSDIEYMEMVILQGWFYIKRFLALIKQVYKGFMWNLCHWVAATIMFFGKL